VEIDVRNITIFLGVKEIVPGTLHSTFMSYYWLYTGKPHLWRNPFLFIKRLPKLSA